MRGRPRPKCSSRTICGAWCGQDWMMTRYSDPSEFQTGSRADRTARYVALSRAALRGSASGRRCGRRAASPDCSSPRRCSTCSRALPWALHALILSGAITAIGAVRSISVFAMCGCRAGAKARGGWNAAAGSRTGRFPKPTTRWRRAWAMPGPRNCGSCICCSGWRGIGKLALALPVARACPSAIRARCALSCCFCLSPASSSPVRTGAAGCGPGFNDYDGQWRPRRSMPGSIRRPIRAWRRSISRPA